MPLSHIEHDLVQTDDIAFGCDEFNAPAAEADGLTPALRASDPGAP